MENSKTHFSQKMLDQFKELVSEVGNNGLPDLLKHYQEITTKLSEHVGSGSGSTAQKASLSDAYDAAQEFLSGLVPDKVLSTAAEHVYRIVNGVGDDIRWVMSHYKTLLPGLFDSANSYLDFFTPAKIEQKLNQVDENLPPKPPTTPPTNNPSAPKTCPPGQSLKTAADGSQYCWPDSFTPTPPPAKTCPPGRKLVNGKCVIDPSFNEF